MISLSPASAGLLRSVLFDPEDGSDMFPPETSGCLRTTRRYDLEYRTLHSYRREKLKSNSFI
jgi:hypothetical protein